MHGCIMGHHQYGKRANLLTGCICLSHQKNRNIMNIRLLEKIIHRVIMKTWHTGMRKEENARAVSIVVANEVMALIEQEMPIQLTPNNVSMDE